MTTATLRKVSYGRTLPERSPYMPEPLSTKPAEVRYTIEPASPEECLMVAERVAEYRADPSSFVPLTSVR
jgi:hypothetical protein